LGAIKYFNSLTGRYREKQSAGVEVNVTNVTGSDMLIRVVEIIQTHVKDPATLEAIANDILSLTNPTAPVNVGQNIIEGKVANYGI
jgi:glycine cleavage system pyridoxal-binding protein P